jgi:hypothetical protein
MSFVNFADYAPLVLEFVKEKVIGKSFFAGFIEIKFSNRCIAGNIETEEFGSSFIFRALWVFLLPFFN